ncbi:MAG TPA: GvpL/GvpF family gas vesicle protein [Gaiellaceae bacterium]|jgi:hypothetical protein|nr:GvpL/GvpF family gas vesicle protein [Gaiellaceae bacterium]
MSERPVYVYGVAAASRSGGLPIGEPGLEGRRLELVCCGELAALVSGIDEPELGRRIARARDGDLTLLVPLFREHEAVLSRAQASGAILPFRFGIVAQGENGVRRLLEERGKDLSAQLERLDDAREWDVKGLVSRELLEADVTAGAPHLAELALEARDGSGAGFFVRKQLERELAASLREAVADIAATAHDRLAAVARSAVVNPPQAPELSGCTDETILDAAYLVERDREAALRASIQELSGELGWRGLRLELTGPRPPFTFVDRPVSAATR